MAAVSNSSGLSRASQDTTKPPIERSFLRHPLFESQVLSHVMQYCGPVAADLEFPSETKKVAQAVVQIASVLITRDSESSTENRAYRFRSATTPLVNTYRQLTYPFQRVEYWKREVAELIHTFTNSVLAVFTRAHADKVQAAFQEAVETRNYPLFRFCFEDEDTIALGDYLSVLGHSQTDKKMNREELSFVHSSLVVETNKHALFRQLAITATLRKDLSTLDFILNDLNFRNRFNGEDFNSLLLIVFDPDSLILILNAIPQGMPIQQRAIEEASTCAADAMQRPDLAQRVQQLTPEINHLG